MKAFIQSLSGETKGPPNSSMAGGARDYTPRPSSKVAAFFKSDFLAPSQPSNAAGTSSSVAAGQGNGFSIPSSQPSYVAGNSSSSAAVPGKSSFCEPSHASSVAGSSSSSAAVAGSNSSCASSLSSHGAGNSSSVAAGQGKSLSCESSHPSYVAGSNSSSAAVPGCNSFCASSLPTHVVGSNSISASVPGDSHFRPASMAPDSPNLDQMSPRDGANLFSQIRQFVEEEVKRALSDSFMQLAKCNDENAQRQVQDQQLRDQQEIQALHNRLKESLETQKKLQEEVETLKPKQAVYTSGSFEDGAPSPPLLRDAHDSMQNALITCAGKLAQNLKAEIGGNHKVLFASQLSECFFQYFETPGFGGTQTDSSASFQRPDKNFKRNLFKEYTNFQTMDTSMLFNSLLPFKTFCSFRFQLFVLNENVPAPFESPELRHDLLRKSIKKNTIADGFTQVAKSVWLLHKLAFACEPTAEIFRIPPGCMYDPEYMEAYDNGDEPDNANDGGGARYVRSMAAPGLTFRSFIIKARVHLQRSSGSQTSALV